MRSLTDDEQSRCQLHVFSYIQCDNLLDETLPGQLRLLLLRSLAFIDHVARYFTSSLLGLTAFVIHWPQQLLR